MKRLFLAVVILLSGVALTAQQSRFMEYYFTPLSYNPAYAGVEQILSASMQHRMRWKNIKGAPQTTFASLHSPIGKTHLALGTDIYYDKIGVSSTTAAYVDLSYYVRLNDRGDRLSFGAKGGVNVFDIALSDLKAGTDPLKKDINGKIKPNFGLGIFYYNARYFVGISALSLLEHNILDTKEDEANFGSFNRMFTATGAYAFDLYSEIQLRPTATIIAEKDKDLLYKGELALNLYDRLWIGAGYNSEKTINGYLFVNVTPEIRLGYNYLKVGEDIGKYVGSMHEIMVGWNIHFGKNKFKFRERGY